MKGGRIVGVGYLQYNVMDLRNHIDKSDLMSNAESRIKNANLRWTSSLRFPSIAFWSPDSHPKGNSGI